MNKLMKEGTLAALLMSLALPAFAGSSVLASDSPARVPGQYIVVFKDLPNMNAAIVHSRTKDVLAPYPKAQVLREYSYAVHGFAARMSEQAATALTQNPSVAYVEADQRAHIFSTQYTHLGD